VYLFLTKELGYSKVDALEVTMLQVQLLMQRHNEPFYKEAIDRKVEEAVRKAQGK
jgi:hypothetical protein